MKDILTNILTHNLSNPHKASCHTLFCLSVCVFFLVILFLYQDKGKIFTTDFFGGKAVGVIIGRSP